MRQRLAERLSAAPAGELRIMSMCAGQGRDVIPVLADHARGSDARTLLVEIDPENAAAARTAAARAGINRLEVLQADAAISEVYASLVPADLVLAAGIFGNISQGDLERTVTHLSMLCREGAAVIWTRHWKEPHIISQIQQWFAASGFWNLSYDALENESRSGVGVALLKAQPMPFNPGFHFFTFLR